VPNFSLADYVVTVVAVLGSTITSCCFFRRRNRLCQQCVVPFSFTSLGRRLGDIHTVDDGSAPHNP
jgi:hypothetical protein